MAIPKQIFQTFKTKRLPFLTRFHIWCLKKKNPNYSYHFYDDSAIEKFLVENFEERIFSAYKKIKIGASKADFFRYAILYIEGGVYLDIDSLISSKIDDFILPTDEALIALEGHGQYYCQWALFFNSGHPFLKQLIEDIVKNIEQSKFPKDVHQTTGPSAYTLAIKKVLEQNIGAVYREIGTDYDNHAKFSYPMSKFFIYGFRRKGHWKREQKK